MPVLELRAGASIAEAIAWGADLLTSSPSRQLDASVLMKAVLGLDDAGLILEGRRMLTLAEAAAFSAMIARRQASEPVAHITGVREFWSLTLETPPGLLVPRPETETLVEAAMGLRAAHEVRAILDLGVGGGCLLCALLTVFPEARGLGVDIDPVAVETARRNLGRLGLADRGAIAASNWGQGVEDLFDLIVSNPPYIPLSDRASLPEDVRAYENPIALFAGADGMDAYRAILVEARRFLSPGGLIILEIGDGHDQRLADLARAAFPQAGVSIAADLKGLPRALTIDARRPEFD